MADAGLAARRGAAALLEREAELAALTAALADAKAGRGSAVLVEGEAGIGKTSLLRAAEQQVAADPAILLARARGGELEREFALGVARQLLEPLARKAPDAVFDGPASHARRILDLAEPEGARPDAGFANHALYWLVANLAADRPVVLVVDDVHWADRPSVNWLVYLARRIEDLGVLLLIGRRTGEPNAHGQTLAALRALSETRVIEPAPLSLDGSLGVMRHALGVEVPGELNAACHEVTGGNPFLLGELAGALTTDGELDLRQAVDRVHALTPAAVARDVLARLGRLGPEALAVAEAVAILGADAQLRNVAALADLPWSAATRARDVLVAGQVLISGPVVTFRHPLLRQAVYDELTPGRRATLHDAAARTLFADEPDAEPVAMHLMAAEPAGEPWVVERLTQAASRLLARGAPDAAYALLERALREPPALAARFEVVMALARAELLVDPPGAVRRLRATAENAAPGPQSDAVQDALVEALFSVQTSKEAIELLERMLDELDENQRERRFALETLLVLNGQFYVERVARVGARLERIAADVTEGSTPTERVLLAALTGNRFFRGVGPGFEIDRLARLALGDGALLHEPTPDSWAFPYVVWFLIEIDELELAAAEMARARANAQERGSALGLAFAAAIAVHLHLAAGDLPAAEHEARLGLRILAELNAPGFVPFLAAELVHTLMARGAADQADEVLRELGLDTPTLPLTGFCSLLLAARVELDLACQRRAEAERDARELIRRRELHGGRIPPVGWRPIAARAAAAVGDLERARALTDAEVEIARDWQVPSQLGRALIAAAELSAGEPAITLLREAVEVLGASPRRLLHAIAQTDLGAALRRAGQRDEAISLLRGGLDLADRCGADGLAERAREELGLAGVHPRRNRSTGPAALTSAELRVARLAADGLSNPEIAQQLFISRKTVEKQLSAAFAKLGITGREGLFDALAPRPALR